jgi:hypothetical protein
MLQSNLHPGDNFSAAHHGKDEGVCLDELAAGAVVEIETQHHHYTLVKDADTHVRVSGHPSFCPKPIEMEMEGSIGSGSPFIPNPGFIGRGMYLVLKHPVFDRIMTSRIREIHVLR